MGAMPRARATKPRKRSIGPPRRTTYHHGNLRRALIDATVALLGEVGSDAFTLREAARRVGVDHRAAYRHFADREGLLAAVAEEGHIALVATLRADLARAPADAPARLLVMAVDYVKFAVASPGRYQVVMGASTYEQYPSTSAAIFSAFSLLREEVAAGISRGELVAGDATEMAAWFWSCIHGLAHLILVRRVKVRPSLVPQFTRTMIGRSLEGVVAQRASLL
jgi:AcrR family transcriptional regulator